MNEPISPELLAAIEVTVRKAVSDAFGEAGLRIDGPDHQDAAREDFRFLRRLRRGIDGAAAKIGWTIIAAIMATGLWLFTLGINAWKGHP